MYAKESDVPLVVQLRRYADDIQSEGRKNAPRCMRLAADRLEAMALRDWAVRVLDAEARARGVDEGPYRPHWTGDDWEIVIAGKLFRFDDTDAARLAAADALWPGLPADVRAEIGARP